MKFIFSIIILPQDNYNMTNLDSIFNQNNDNIQIIFLKEDNDLIEKYKKSYPENISIFNEDNFTINDINGDYIHFSNLNNYYSENTFASINDFILKNGDLNIVSPGNANQIINLNDNADLPVSDITQIFIKKSCLDNQTINKIIDGCDFFYFNRLLDDNEKLGIADTGIQSKTQPLISENWLSRRILQYQNLLDSPNIKNKRLIKYNIISDLNTIINSASLNQIEDHDKFKDNLENILVEIEDEIIKKHAKLNINTKSFLLYLKNNEFHVEIKKDKIFLKTGNNIINRLHNRGIILDIVDIRDNLLNISGAFKSSCNSDFLDFQAVLNYSDGTREIITAQKTEYPTTNRARKTYLGIDWTFNPSFDFNIPIKSNNNFKIDFRIAYHEDNNEKILKINKVKFQKFCNLSELSNYFIKDNHIVLYRDNSIHVTDYSSQFRFKLELVSMGNIIKSGAEYAWYSIYIRILYFILYLFWKNKRIWLFEDRPLVADDNAKHLFSYAVRQDDDIKKYYILDKNSKEFNDMKKISKNIVAFGSLKHKMLYLFSEKFISSHSGNYVTNPFYDYNEALFCGLNPIEKVFLQHGITIHDVSNWLRKYRHNFYLFVTASDYEQKSILHENYNYTDEVVKTLGFPRYDNLNNHKLKNEILFMPTWRKGINNEEDFLNSPYYHNIESFFNNERLLDILKNNDFKIVFKPHFETLEYIHCFSIPEEVELNVDDSYQTLFNESMILITDYSSVFFDFAYLKKPVIYYRDDTRFHYDEGYFDFETMGFGEIIKNEDVLVDKIEEYILNDCKMETEFIKRVDEFFKFDDKNNCKRVYDCLYKIK